MDIIAWFILQIVVEELYLTTTGHEQSQQSWYKHEGLNPSKIIYSHCARAVPLLLAGSCCGQLTPPVEQVYQVGQS